MRPFQRIGVVGAGLMGHGIAQVAATSGYATVVRDISPEVLERARGATESSLAKFVDKGMLTAPERSAALERLTFTTDLADLAAADLVIEAVPEDLELKNELWRALRTITDPAAVFATNTSSLPLSGMVSSTGRGERFVGLHFFSPVPLMPLVEVVRAEHTSAETLARVAQFARSLGKEVIVATDTPGFIVNRLLVPYLIDAVRALEDGLGSVADIDLGMKLGCGHPMGPLTLLDMIGLDTACRVAEVLREGLGEPRFAPPPLLLRLVGEGRLGRKTKRGFYDYATDPPTPIEVG